MELAFGNVVIGLARSDLSLFLRRIAELQALPPSARIPVLYLTDTGLGVRFSREELLELRELLESALLLGARDAMGAICAAHSVSGSVVH